MVTFLSQVFPALEALDVVGELGRELTALEVAVAMLDIVQTKNDLRRTLALKFEAVTNEVLQITRETGRQLRTGEFAPSEAQVALAEVERQFENWEPMGSFSGIKEHCLEVLRDAKRQLASGNRRLSRAD